MAGQRRSRPRQRARPANRINNTYFFKRSQPAGQTLPGRARPNRYDGNHPAVKKECRIGTADDQTVLGLQGSEPRQACSKGEQAVGRAERCLLSLNALRICWMPECSPAWDDPALQTRCLNTLGPQWQCHSEGPPVLRHTHPWTNQSLDRPVLGQGALKVPTGVTPERAAPSQSSSHTQPCGHTRHSQARACRFQRRKPRVGPPK